MMKPTSGSLQPRISGVRGSPAPADSSVESPKALLPAADGEKAAHPPLTGAGLFRKSQARSARAELQDLPVELYRNNISHTVDGRSTSRDDKIPKLRDLSLVSRAVNIRVKSSSGSSKMLLSLRNDRAAAQDEMHHILARAPESLDDEDFMKAISIADILSPNQRKTLFSHFASRPGRETSLALSVQAAGGMIEHLSEPARDQLVALAASLSMDASREFAFDGLSAQFEHLSAGSRDLLVESLFRSRFDILNRANIDRVAPLLSQLSERAHRMIIDCIKKFPTDNSIEVAQKLAAIRSLCSGFEHFSEDNRINLFSMMEEHEGSDKYAETRSAMRDGHMRLKTNSPDQD